MKLQSNNLNKVSLVSLLFYAILKILLQVEFRIWFVIGQEIIFCLDLIQFSQESTYIEFQHILTTVLKMIPFCRYHHLHFHRHPGQYHYCWSMTETEMEN